jgi:cell fate regulator YaaT (PSP1 superfamily)
MAKYVGIRFQPAGKIYFFESPDETVQINEQVIVDTNRGRDLGKIVTPPVDTKPADITEPLKQVIRKATPEDIKQSERQQKRTEKALSKCRELVAKLNLGMKPVSAHYNIDGSHIVIFFIAEKRVDFRELVKDLSHELKSYVELRQVGARDESKLVGGLGKCGQPLCCTTFLTEFNPVSIKMAKEQNITLNPMKTSGLCGRLLCCLGYEFEQYRNIKQNLPDIHQFVNTPMGRAKVMNMNTLKGSIWVELESGAVVEYNVNQITWQKQERPRPEQREEKPRVEVKQDRQKVESREEKPGAVTASDEKPKPQVENPPQAGQPNSSGTSATPQ